MSARLRLLIFLLVATFGGIAATCGEGGSGSPVNQPPRKAYHVHVFVLGKGQSVWVLVVADSKQTVFTHKQLPYRDEFTYSYAIKVEAKNGPKDYGTLECQIQDDKGRIVPGGHDVAGGPSAEVLCLHDGTVA